MGVCHRFLEGLNFMCYLHSYERIIVFGKKGPLKGYNNWVK